MSDLAVEHVSPLVEERLDHIPDAWARLLADADYGSVASLEDALALVAALNDALVRDGVQVFWREGNLWLETDAYLTLSREMVLQPGRHLMKSLLPGFAQ